MKKMSMLGLVAAMAALVMDGFAFETLKEAKAACAASADPAVWAADPQVIEALTNQFPSIEIEQIVALEYADRGDRTNALAVAGTNAVWQCQALYRLGDTAEADVLADPLMDAGTQVIAFYYFKYSQEPEPSRCARMQTFFENRGKAPSNGQLLRFASNSGLMLRNPEWRAFWRSYCAELAEAPPVFKDVGQAEDWSKYVLRFVD